MDSREKALLFAFAELEKKNFDKMKNEK